MADDPKRPRLDFNAFVLSLGSSALIHLGEAPDPVSGVGELLIRGSNVVAGYWNMPEATRAAFATGAAVRIIPSVGSVADGIGAILRF